VTLFNPACMTWPVLLAAYEEVMEVTVFDRRSPSCVARMWHGRHFQIRRYPCGHPDPFKTVRDLGLISPCCPLGSGPPEYGSSVWLPAGDLQIRRSGHIIQDRPSLAVRWADIPDLSLCVSRCLALGSSAEHIPIY
jgi:hypothetical protein